MDATIYHLIFGLVFSRFALSLSLSLSMMKTFVLKIFFFLRCNCFIFLPGSEVPNWFSHKRIGSSISFHVPSLAESEIRVLLICFVYAKKKELDP
jgi:hypothetical protein